MTEDEIAEAKAKIDQMPHIEMARLYRFSSPGHPYFRTDLPLWEHFKKRFDELGGMTAEISKKIGW